jgi:hypothetical protein
LIDYFDESSIFKDKHLNFVNGQFDKAPVIWEQTFKFIANSIINELNGQFDKALIFSGTNIKISCE